VSVASKALETQGRVIWALILREIKTLFGNLKLGYLWVIIQTAFGIAVFWAVRAVLGARATQGIDVPVFLITGFTVWNIFSDCIMKGMAAIDGNKGLLTFPQVFPLDLILARGIVIWCTHLLVMGLLLSLAVFWGYTVEFAEGLTFITTLVLTFILGIGMGALFSALNTLWPTTSTIVPMVLRSLFFLSGIFYSVAVFPRAVRDLLLYNPVLLLIEMLRTGMSESYVSVDISIGYLLMFILTANVLGLLLERFARRRIEQ